MKSAIILALILLRSACECVTAYYIPGIGNFDLDPMPLSDEDKLLHYNRLKELFDLSHVGQSTLLV